MNHLDDFLFKYGNLKLNNLNTDKYDNIKTR